MDRSLLTVRQYQIPTVVEKVVTNCKVIVRVIPMADIQVPATNV